ncbi:MAG: SAM-dependent methyltransferase [Chloroflexota bacterium]
MGDNLIDTSKPSAGRIYDYMLGGSHNFEVDRQAADALYVYMPFITKFARLQRWALKDVAEELTFKRGYDVIIDFASGLPTMDHLHTFAKKGTTIIYSDIDPVVVEYAREILAGVENTYFFENDACYPEQLLNIPEVKKILNGRRKVGIGFWGFSTFQNDEELAHSMQSLYDWAAPGSTLAYNANSVTNPDDPEIKKSIELYKSFGSPFYVRSLESHKKLISPWKASQDGFISLLDWNGFDQSIMSELDEASLGPQGGGFGAFITR